jgi:hypothetical protein
LPSWIRIRIQQLKLMRIHADPDPDTDPDPKPWLAVQCSGKFFDKKLRVPPRLTLGL